jgi:hypothetical protein
MALQDIHKEQNKLMVSSSSNSSGSGGNFVRRGGLVVDVGIDDLSRESTHAAFSAFSSGDGLIRKGPANNIWKQQLRELHTQKLHTQALLKATPDYQEEAVLMRSDLDLDIDGRQQTVGERQQEPYSMGAEPGAKGGHASEGDE